MQNMGAIQNRILFYPTYVPSKIELRRLLLLYDTISTIVPSIDQANVLRRPQLEELLEANVNIFAFVEPEEYVNWAQRDGISATLHNMIDKVGDTNHVVRDRIDEIRRKAGSRDDFSITQEDAHFFLEHNWVPVSKQRISQDLVEELCDNYLALSVFGWLDGAGNMITANPLVLHPQVANFVRSRLAREVASDLSIPALSFKDEDVANFTFDPKLRNVDLRTTLLSISMPILLPEDLDQLTVSDYLSIRDEYSEVRDNINVLIKDLMVKRNLEDLPDGRATFERIEFIHQTVQKELDRAQQNIDRRRFEKRSTLGVTALSTIVAGVIVNPLFGGLAGLAIEVLGEKYVNAYSTLKDGSQHFESFVALRASVDRHIRSQNFALPSYHRTARYL